MDEKYHIINILNKLVKPKFNEIVEFKIGEKPIFNITGEHPLHLLIVVVKDDEYYKKEKITNEIISILKYISLQNKVVILFMTD
jgi:hypothetical protein